MTQEKERIIPPIHQWTHDGERVLLVKCVENDMTTYGGFVWPKAGPVEPTHWGREATCESGGLFGRPWGIGLGVDKDPNATKPWLVFAAKPENVIAVSNKAKAVPGEDDELPEVVYCGDMAGAMEYTSQGRISWVFGGADEKSTSSGDYSNAASSGYGSNAASSGYGSNAASSGYRSNAASSGYGSNAASSGNWSNAASSGYGSNATVTGQESIATANGDTCTVDVSATSLGAVYGRAFDWEVRLGAVVVQRWRAEDGARPAVLLDSTDIGLRDGEVVRVVEGKIVTKGDTQCEAN